MKKKIFSAMLLFAFTLGTTSTFVSCKDYDDDINNLQKQIDDLKTTVDQIETLISSGSVITSTTSITNGVRVTLSNGQSFDLLNGTDGEDGTVWTIGSDNYWYQDGVKTSYLAVGQKGEDGAAGANGKDGIYYVPNAETGYFDIYNGDGTLQGASNIQWKTGAAAIYAVMDKNDLTLYGLTSEDGTPLDPIVISLSGDLRSLVFSGDREVNGEIQRAYIDGVPGIRVSSLTFSPEKINKKDSKDENATIIDAKKSVVVRGDTYAYYHVNPASTNIDKIKDAISYVVKANADYIQVRTRANASEDFNVVPTIESYDSENGILKVKVATTGKAATEEKISVVALQVAKESKDTVTSDYATIYDEEMKDFYLADAKNSTFASKKTEEWVDWHYRRADDGLGISKVDAQAGNEEATVNTKAAWVTGADADGSDIDIECDYTGSVDLDERVVLHYNGVHGTTACSVADLNALGMTRTYEIVKNYKLDSNETEQGAFATLTGSVVTANSTYGIAAVGRTPIIRITLTDANGNIVRVAYAKIKFVQKIANPEASLTPGDGKFTFDCEKNGVLTSTWEQMNVQVYKEVGLSKEEFHLTYGTFDGNNVAGQVGTVTENIDTSNGETTHTLTWTLTPDEMWQYAGQTVKHVVYYKSTASKKVEITLTATVDGVTKQKNFTTAEYTPNYWDDAKTYTKLNVRVPGEATGNEPSSKCVFVDGLNEPFKLDDNGTKAYIGKGDYTLNYYFCADNEGDRTVGGIKINVSLSAQGGDTTPADSTHLYAQKYDSKGKLSGTYSLIATITNTPTSNGVESKQYNNVVEYAQTDLAKELLNTNEMTALFGLRAYACGDVTTWEYDADGKYTGNPGKQVLVTFNGLDHFTGKFIRPINLADAASDNFIDGVNVGQKGSFLPVEDLITPTDWRDYSFVTYPKLYTYYGVTGVAVDTENALTDLSTDGSLIKVSASAIRDVLSYETVTTETTVTDPTKANQVLGPDGKTYVDYSKTSNYGFVYYRNQGNKVEKDFNLYLDITVTYKWGQVIKTQVKVPVAKTIGSN